MQDTLKIYVIYKQKKKRKKTSFMWRKLVGLSIMQLVGYSQKMAELNSEPITSL